MIKRRKTKNGRKLTTFVKNRNYSLWLSRPARGVKDHPTMLSISVINPVTGSKRNVRLDGSAVRILKNILDKQQ